MLTNQLHLKSLQKAYKKLTPLHDNKIFAKIPKSVHSDEQKTGGHVLAVNNKLRLFVTTGLVELYIRWK